MARVWVLESQIFLGLPEVPGPEGRGLGQSKFNWWEESWQPGGGEGEGRAQGQHPSGLRWPERPRRARSGKLLDGHTGFHYPRERTCSVPGHLAPSQTWKLSGWGRGHVLCFSETLATPHTLVLNTPSAGPPLALDVALPSPLSQSTIRKAQRGYMTSPRSHSTSVAG